MSTAFSVLIIMIGLAYLGVGVAGVWCDKLEKRIESLEKESKS